MTLLLEKLTNDDSYVVLKPPKTQFPEITKKKRVKFQFRARELTFFNFLRN